jgi:micrococcal nuclease
MPKNKSILLIALILCLWGTEAIAKPRASTGQLCTIKRVIDGDTVEAECNQVVKKLRFCGIDTPEKSQPFSEEATARTEFLINADGGKFVAQITGIDRFDRLIANLLVWNGDRFESVNENLIKAGLAYIYPEYIYKCANRADLRKGEESARSAKLNLWSGEYERPWDFRRDERESKK